MIKNLLSVLKRVFDLLLGILSVLGILEPFVGGHLAGLDLLLLATTTTFIVTIALTRNLINVLKLCGKSKSGVC
ncbi:hypothetical protein AKJ55_00760 [candidate division MSBL1 archaeon SCGC-AAA382M17]|uniref:Uncharacterized protein n=1 Tax=candidate division MSBL1 archaeon SCGC-AAA382M17 TaxID=1698284 RepID=A0ABR5TMG5_9EURY|nr:hypothetical protein AKJ55_00760 [candidate division MSBL1 archaeon SCGC-AAA382M17]